MKMGIIIKKKTLGLFVLLATTFLGTPSRASQRTHAYTYGTSVVAPGQVELEPWVTATMGKDSWFLRLENRLELEVGVAPHLQTALYLKTRSTAEGDGAGGLSKSSLVGFANEWKLQFLDPVADPLGLGLYWEWGAWPHELEFEAKLLLDKAMGPVFAAFNLVGELEVKPVPAAAAELEAKLEFLLGVSFYLGKGAHLGFEAQEGLVWEDSELEKALLSVGPSLAVHGSTAWFAVTVLPQVVDLKTGKRNISSAEVLEARILMGVDL